MRLRLEDRGDHVEGRAASTRADDLVWRRVPGEGLVRDHEDTAPVAGAALVPCQLRRAQRGCGGLPPHVPNHRGERYEREECDAGNGPEEVAEQHRNAHHEGEGKRQPKGLGL